MTTEMTKETPLDVMQKLVHESSKAHGWYTCQDCLGNEGGYCQSCKGTRVVIRNIPEMLALIHSEVSEALEDYRNQRLPLDQYTMHDDKPEGFGVELADIVIRVMDLAEYLSIDLAEMIVLKYRYQLTRPHRHGGKLC